MRQCKAAKLSEKKHLEIVEESAAKQPQQCGGSQKLEEWAVRAAFSGQTHNLTAVAREFGKSRRQVVRAVKSVAMAVLERQKLWMTDFMLGIRNGSIILDVFWDSLRWDEAQKLLTLDFSKLVDGSQSIATWNVMVSKRRIGWRRSGSMQMESLEIVMVPIVLVGCVTADSFCDALFNSRQATVVETFIRFCRSCARANCGRNG